MDHPTYLKLKSFLEDRPICREAARPLSKSAAVRIFFTDHEDEYRFRMQDGLPRLEPGQAEKPDFTLRLPTGAVDDLINLPEETIPAFGVKLMELVWTAAPERKISATIHNGPVRLFAHGYFGILAKGGMPVMRYLASRGFGQIGTIRKRMSQLVKPVE